MEINFVDFKFGRELGTYINLALRSDVVCMVVVKSTLALPYSQNTTAEYGCQIDKRAPVENTCRRRQPNNHLCLIRIDLQFTSSLHDRNFISGVPTREDWKCSVTGYYRYLRFIADSLKLANRLVDPFGVYQTVVSRWSSCHWIPGSRIHKFTKSLLLPRIS